MSLSDFGKLYVLDAEKIPVVAENIEQWVEFMQSPARWVDRTEIGEVLVSTVFLGMLHAGSTLFESMAFLIDGDGLPISINASQRRYMTFDEAVEGHKEIVAFIKAQYHSTSDIALTGGVTCRVDHVLG